MMMMIIVMITIHEVCAGMSDSDRHLYLYMCMFRATIVDKLMIIIEVDCNSGDNT